VEHIPSANQDHPLRLEIQHIDSGLVGEFGAPVGYSKRVAFPLCTGWVWNRAIKLDVVSIDGRLRVCCFLAGLKHAFQGMRIVFDDYEREQYRIVEKYLKPVEQSECQALFLVSSTAVIDLSELAHDLKAFRLVID